MISGLLRGLALAALVLSSACRDGSASKARVAAAAKPPRGPSAAVLTTKQAREFSAWYDARPTQPWPVRQPTMDDIPDGPRGALIRRGIAILTDTPAWVGPHAPEPQMRLSHNSLKCVSCHPAGPSGLPGTRRLRLPYFNVVNDYPKLDVKLMRIVSLEDRVRGMFGGGNGRLGDNSDVMRAILAYFEFLAEGTQPNAAMVGTHLPFLEPPARPADPERGAELYTRYCRTCHGHDGHGVQAPDFAKGGGYEVPPIAGNDTYSDAGHMYLIPLFARFIYGYMPAGAGLEAAVLTPEQAFDIAAYVNDRLPRTHVSKRARFYPDPVFRPAFFSIPELFPGDPAAARRAKFGPFDRDELRHGG